MSSSSLLTHGQQLFNYNMLFNITHKNDEIEESIDERVGRAFSVLKALKYGSIGSRRMLIQEMSTGLQPAEKRTSGLQYGNIELRPKGIILHINKGGQIYAWIIPYYRLSVFMSDTFTIHAEGEFIRFNKEKTLAENNKFIKKMMLLKAEYTV